MRTFLVFALFISYVLSTASTCTPTDTTNTHSVTSDIGDGNTLVYKSIFKNPGKGLGGDLIRFAIHQDAVNASGLWVRVTGAFHFQGKTTVHDVRIVFPRAVYYTETNGVPGFQGDVCTATSDATNCPVTISTPDFVTHSIWTNLISWNAVGTWCAAAANGNGISCSLTGTDSVTGDTLTFAFIIPESDCTVNNFPITASNTAFTFTWVQSASKYNNGTSALVIRMESQNAIRKNGTFVSRQIELGQDVLDNGLGAFNFGTTAAFTPSTTTVAVSESAWFADSVNKDIYTGLRAFARRVTYSFIQSTQTLSGTLCWDPSVGANQDTTGTTSSAASFVASLMLVLACLLF